MGQDYTEIKNKLIQVIMECVKLIESRELRSTTYNYIRVGERNAHLIRLDRKLKESGLKGKLKFVNKHINKIFIGK